MQKHTKSVDRGRTRTDWLDSRHGFSFGGWVDPDPVVNAFVSLEAQAFALVPDRAFTPVRSLLRYEFRGDDVEEVQERARDPRALRSTRRENGARSVEQREFPEPVTPTTAIA